MVSVFATRRGSIPLPRDDVNPQATTVSKGKFKNKLRASTLNATPLKLPPLLSDDVSSSHQCPQTPPEPDITNFFVTQDTVPCDYHGSIDENDIVIAVMGLTGAGKSSFVKTTTGNTEVLVGHDLASRTRDVRSVRCTHRPNVVLVDTPGFDDTHLSDAEILKTIAKWLKETYQNSIKLAGILYLHRISDNRMAGTPLRNLSVFRDLCGNANLKNIVLVTTMWDDVESKLGSERERDLLSSFWKDMVHLGSRTLRYEGTPESAWNIINQLDLEASFRKRAPLQIQREMVDQGLQLYETTAGKTFLRSLGEEFKRVWAKIRGRARRPMSPVRQTGGLRKAIIRRSSIRSLSSEAGRSMTSFSDTSSVVSRTSTRPSSVADSFASGCSTAGRREALSAMTRGLKIVHEAAGIIPFPFLRGAIGTVLSIAQLIEEMNGTHHAISQVVESSGWLLEEITQYAMKSHLSEDLKRALKSFQQELKRLLNVVKKVANRGHIARFLLHDADIQAISECNTSIRMIYEKLGVKMAMESYQAIARLEEEMALLRGDKECRECQCGSWVVHEESEEFFDAESHRSIS